MNFFDASSFSSLPILINAIGWALIHFLWQGALIGCATAFLLMLLRNARPQIRYALSCVALLLCVILPLREVFSRLNSSAGAMPYPEAFAAGINTGVAHLSPAFIATWLQVNINWLVLWWLVTVLLLSVRLGLGLIWVSGYQKDKRSTADTHWQQRLNHLAEQFGLQRHVVLRVVHDLDGPITVGCWHPIVLLPAALVTGMPVHLLEALLAHELAHISRFDYLLNLLQNLIEMLLFFHPAVWWISKNIRNEREQIADDLAARILGEPRRLALALQELELFQFSTPQLAQAAHGGNLMSRIKRLLRPEVQALNWKAALSVVGLSAACLAVIAHAAAPMEEKTAAKTSMSGTPLEQKMAGKNANAGQGKVIRAGAINFANPGCKPEYPKEALRHEQQGTVRLSVLLGIDGEVSDVKIDRSSKFRILDDAVKDKLLSGTCKSKPGTVNGALAATWVKVQYVWKLVP